MTVIRTVSIETPTHGRVLIEDAADVFSGRILVAFHGYGQSADDICDEVRRIPGVSTWQVVCVQALHRFYTRQDQRVVASWMTREDREHAISDNVEYVDRVLDHLWREAGREQGVESRRLVFLGFSQGAAMAYRAAVGGRHGASGIVALAGDIPPELKAADAKAASPWPPVLIGVGSDERWYGPEKLDADVAFLRARDVPHEVVRFTGGHDWTEEFRGRVWLWLDELTSHA